jgi:hypothetical protein
MNTSAKTLLVTLLWALAIAMFVAIIAMVFIAIAT